MPISDKGMGSFDKDVLLKSPTRYARKALGAHSRYVMSPLSWTTKPNFSVPLLNFSRPPSVSSIVLIHFWAWLYLLRRASLKGSSHGSSLITPEQVNWGTSKLSAGTHQCHLQVFSFHLSPPLPNYRTRSSGQKSSCEAPYGLVLTCVGQGEGWTVIMQKAQSEKRIREAKVL